MLKKVFKTFSVMLPPPPKIYVWLEQILFTCVTTLAHICLHRFSLALLMK